MTPTVTMMGKKSSGHFVLAFHVVLCGRYSDSMVMGKLHIKLTMMASVCDFQSLIFVTKDKIVLPLYFLCFIISYDSFRAALVIKQDTVLSILQMGTR